jgi:hypothetical protein
MVHSSIARIDVDNELLTKVITYRKFTSTTTDLAYDIIDRSSYVDYSIKAQCTVQTMDKTSDIMGVIRRGDLVGLFRYQYEYDASNNSINPILIPKKGDMIYFINRWFVIKQCTAATSEDENIIGWDFTAGETS